MQLVFLSQTRRVFGVTPLAESIRDSIRAFIMAPCLMHKLVLLISEIHYFRGQCQFFFLCTSDHLQNTSKALMQNTCALVQSTCALARAHVCRYALFQGTAGEQRRVQAVCRRLLGAGRPPDDVILSNHRPQSRPTARQVRASVGRLGSPPRRSRNIIVAFFIALHFDDKL